jgi:formate dehydrogenase subunit beta
MIEAIVDVQGSTLKTLQALLRDLLEKGVVEALLVPMILPSAPSRGGVAPMLVTDPAALDRADPLAPVMPINAARAVQALTVTGQRQKLGVVLRACEIRAVVELVKFQQVKLDRTLLLGIDCLGTYGVTEYQAIREQGIGDRLVEELLGGAVHGELKPHEGLAFRAACQMCEQPLPEGEHVALTIGLVGVEAGRVYVKAREDVAEALGLGANGAPPGRAKAAEKLIAARVQARDAAFAELRGRVASRDMAGLLEQFSSCIRCHNCMVNCPICYCRECIFRTPTFEHDSELYYQWAERKGTVRLLPDTMLFHLTRLNHMVTSCVGCGMCTDACPADIPVGTLFRSVGQQAQALFDYHPGRSLDEAAPVQEFREDELTALGERPHS